MVRSTEQTAFEPCKTCNGLEWVRANVPISDPQFGKLQRCPDCGGESRINHLLSLSRLEGDLAGSELNQWRPLPGVESVQAQIKRYLFRQEYTDKTAPGWIILSGPHGTGKTHLLAAMIRHFARAGRPSIYTTAQKVLQDLRDSIYEEGGQPRSQLWADIQTANVLAIDDLEYFSGTAWAQEQVFALLTHRYDNRKTLLTLIGTNVDCRGDRFRILPAEGSWAASRYLESRVKDARNCLITDFWDATDVRELLRDIL